MRGERAGELAAGADAQRGEHLPQVIGDGRRADVQLRGDLGVRDTLAGQPGDMRFPRGQGSSRLRGAFGGPLARCAQLNPRAFGERPGAGREEDLHDAAVTRLLQLGVVPVSWLSFASELQRTYDNADTVGIYFDVQMQAPGFAKNLNTLAARQSLARPS